MLANINSHGLFPIVRRSKYNEKLIKRSFVGLIFNFLILIFFLRKIFISLIWTLNFIFLFYHLQFGLIYVLFVVWIRIFFLLFPVIFLSCCFILTFWYFDFRTTGGGGAVSLWAADRQSTYWRTPSFISSLNWRSPSWCQLSCISAIPR